jgi:hypothetical protein
MPVCECPETLNGKCTNVGGVYFVETLSKSPWGNIALDGAAFYKCPA